jgi:hypothetical protein
MNSVPIFLKELKSQNKPKTVEVPKFMGSKTIEDVEVTNNSEHIRVESLLGGAVPSIRSMLEVVI